MEKLALVWRCLLDRPEPMIEAARREIADQAERLAMLEMVR